MIERVLVFGDDYGVPVTLRCLDARLVIGVVGAAIRPATHEALATIARDLRVPFIVQPKFSSAHYAQFVEEVTRLAPELIIVNSYSMLLRPDILALPSYAAVNVHPARLPQYRGSNPWQWALLNHEWETAVTLHHMTSELDAGDIVSQEPVTIEFEDTWCDLRDKSLDAMERLLLRSVPLLLAGAAPRTPQDEACARHWPRRRREDGLIDWNEPVLRIYNLIRALVEPHPGAYYRRGEDEIILNRYHSIAEVVRLKYGDAGGYEMRGGSVVLMPQQNVGNKNDVLEFQVIENNGEAAGFIALTGIDWRRREAEMVAADVRAPLRDEACILLTLFAGRELGLNARQSPAAPYSPAQE